MSQDEESVPTGQGDRLRSGQPLHEIGQVHGHATGSILRIPAVGWKPEAPATGWPAGVDFQPVNGQALQTYQGRLPLTSVLIQFTQNLVQGGDWCCWPRFPHGGQCRRCQPARVARTNSGAARMRRKYKNYRMNQILPGAADQYRALGPH